MNQDPPPSSASAPLNRLLRLAMPLPLRHGFDYLPLSGRPLPLPGERVLAPLGARKLTGVMLEAIDPAQSPVKSGQLLEVLDYPDAGRPTLPGEILGLCLWAAEYYRHPLGEVLNYALPVALRKGADAAKKTRATSTGAADEPLECRPAPYSLNAGQQEAIRSLQAKKDLPGLLQGVTSSGKTEVYLQLIAEVLQKGRQVLVLVPEISLTPQTLARFSARFSPEPVALHSGLAPGRRLQAWKQAAEGRARIVIGTRSAIFTPMPKLGLVIVDEEHDSSYKQQDGFRYSARDLAVFRARSLKIPVLLGSATPSLESLHNARAGRYHSVQLRERAGGASQPKPRLLDLKLDKVADGLGQKLLGLMEKHLDQGGQVLAFLNRRGYSPVIMCAHCNWTASCSACDAKLTLHKARRALICHHCGQTRSLPRHCPECGGEKLHIPGAGTERAEEALVGRFPEIPVIRIDSDTTRQKGSLEDRLAQVRKGNPCILLGTQMLAKGHHFPHVSLSAVIDVDGALYSSDFRALERLGQTFVQVGGRAGRAERPGEVALQTFHPESPHLRKLLAGRYDLFIESLLAERRASGLPPFSYLVALRAEAGSMALAREFLMRQKQLALPLCPPEVRLFGPAPALMERRAGRYRAQLLLASKSRPHLHRELARLLPLWEGSQQRGLRWFLDVDPLEIQ